MPLDAKIFAGYNIVIIVMGFAGAVPGVILATKHFPKNAGGCTTDPADDDLIDRFNGFISFMGFLCIVGAILEIIGGGFGAGAGFMKSRCSMITTCFLLSIACVVAGAAGSFSAWVALFIDQECGERHCNAFNYCPKQGCDNGCTDHCPGQVDTCRGWCKGHYDYFCDDLKGTLIANAVVFILGLILAIPGCAGSCGAACCCPERFSMDQPKVGESGGPQAVVVGQPVK